MATIIHKRLYNHFSISLLRFLLPAFILFVPQPVTSQGKPKEAIQGKVQEAPVRRKVEILHSDAMEFDRMAYRSRKKLLGHVSLKHNDLYMTCDSAWYYDDTNQVFAFSNIHIQQGDTIHIYGRY
ncbi:MAG TPA: OstA-like protein, partial [Bacteroidales bacterium]|nr:OstA-like protein [Bacteroidales bacterium]